MEQINITSAINIYGHEDSPKANQVIGYRIVVDGEILGVPADPANRHYAEIMRQVEADELVIQEAES